MMDFLFQPTMPKSIAILSLCNVQIVTNLASGNPFRHALIPSKNIVLPLQQTWNNQPFFQGAQVPLVGNGNLEVITEVYSMSTFYW
jgi:hypothetical protein